MNVLNKYWNQSIHHTRQLSSDLSKRETSHGNVVPSHATHLKFEGYEIYIANSINDSDILSHPLCSANRLQILDDYFHIWAVSLPWQGASLEMMFSLTLTISLMSFGPAWARQYRRCTCEFCMVTYKYFLHFFSALVYIVQLSIAIIRTL